MDELENQVRVWSRRARLQHSVALSFFGVSCGLGLALIIALAARLTPLLDQPTLVGLSVALAVAGLTAAVSFPWMRHARTPLLTWARSFDQRFDLKDRLSTALEVSAGSCITRSDVIRYAQRRDASAAAASIDICALLPLRVPPRDMIAALILLVALLLALFLPNPQQDSLAQRERLRQAIAQQVEQLEQAKQVIAQSSLSEAQKQAAIQALEDAQRALTNLDVTPEEALAALNEAQAKLDALNDLDAYQLAEDLRRAGQRLSADSLTNPLANALANQDFERAADALRDIGQAGQDGGQPNQATAQRAADQLDQLARGVQNSSPELAQHLRAAAQHLRQGELAAAQQQLEQAAQVLERTQAANQAGQALERAQVYAESARQSIAQQASLSDQASSAGQSQLSDQGGSPRAREDARANGHSMSLGSDAASAGRPADSSVRADGHSMSLGSDTAGTSRLADGNARALPGNATSMNRAGKSDDVGTSNLIYAPHRIGDSGQTVVLPNAQSPSVPDPAGRASPAPAGSSSVPYEQVYGDYARAVDEALQRGRIPPEMREYIRDYFSSLNPAQRER
jgi:hypothetical protein